MKDLGANWRPQSDMILSSNPNHLYRFSNNNCAVFSAMIVFEQGMRIIPLVSLWSIITRMESCPFTRGRSVMKSMEQFKKGLVVKGPSMGKNNGLAGHQAILNCWHMPHPWI